MLLYDRNRRGLSTMAGGVCKPGSVKELQSVSAVRIGGAEKFPLGMAHEQEHALHRLLVLSLLRSRLQQAKNAWNVSQPYSGGLHGVGERTALHIMQ